MILFFLICVEYIPRTTWTWVRSTRQKRIALTDTDINKKMKGNRSGGVITNYVR